MFSLSWMMMKAEEQQKIFNDNVVYNNGSCTVAIFFTYKKYASLVYILHCTITIFAFVLVWAKNYT